MTKVIVLSTVLGLGALGMACGEAPANNVNIKVSTTPAPVANVAPVNVAPPANAPANVPANAMGARPAANDAMKPAAVNAPAANANKK